MRWDFDSRKLAYENSERKISFEQELDSLKTILAQDDESRASKSSFFKKKGIVLLVTLVALAIVVGISSVLIF